MLLHIVCLVTFNVVITFDGPTRDTCQDKSIWYEKRSMHFFARQPYDYHDCEINMVGFTNHKNRVSDGYIRSVLIMGFSAGVRDL